MFGDDHNPPLNKNHGFYFVASNKRVCFAAKTKPICWFSSIIFFATFLSISSSFLSEIRLQIYPNFLYKGKNSVKSFPYKGKNGLRYISEERRVKSEEWKFACAQPFFTQMNSSLFTQMNSSLFTQMNSSFTQKCRLRSIPACMGLPRCANERGVWSAELLTRNVLYLVLVRLRPHRSTLTAPKFSVA